MNRHLSSIILLVLLAAPVLAAPALNGTQHYYPLDSGASRPVDVRSGSNMTIAASANYTTNPKVLGNASFLWNKASFGQLDSFSLPAQGSISFWLWLNSSEDQQVFDTSNTANGINSQFSLGGTGGLFFRTDADASFIATGSLPLQTKTHVVLWWNGSQDRIYINGVLNVSGTGGAVNTGARTFYVARDNANTASLYLNGTMDELGFFNYSLSSQDITDLYNGGSGLAYPFSVTGGNQTLSFLLNNTVSGASITAGAYCLNATGSNTSHNFCTRNSTLYPVNFSTTGTYNITLYDLSTVGETTAQIGTFLPGNLTIGALVRSSLGGPALFLSGNGSFVDLGTSQQLNLTSPLSIYAELNWTRNSTLPQAVLIYGQDLDPQNTPYDLRINGNGTVSYSYEYDIGTNVICTTTQVLAQNANSSILVTIDGENTTSIYLNGALAQTCTSNRAPQSSTDNMNPAIGRDTGAGHDALNASVYRVYLWNTTLTPSEASAQNTSQFPITPRGLVGAWQADSYNATHLADTKWRVGRLNHSRTAPAYFNTSLLSYNFSATGMATLSTFQALITLTAQRLFLNTSIQSFNATNDKAFNTTSTGSLTLPANNGTQFVNTMVLGNYSRNQSCTVTNPLSTQSCVATGFYDTELVIGARNGSGAVITQFNVTVTNQTLFNLSNFSTTNGTITIPALQNFYYSFLFNATNYSLANASIRGNASTTFYNFSILSYNTFELHFLNESTDTRLQNTTVYFELITDNFAQNYTAINASTTVTLLVPGNYTIRYYQNPDVPRDYYVTLTEQSYQNLSLYVVDEDISQIYLPVVYNENTQPLANVTVTLLRYYVGSNNYKPVEMTTTDTNGQGVLRVVPNIINYKLLICGSGVCTTTSPTKFTSSTNGYTLSLTQNVLTSITAMPSVSQSLTFNNATNTYVFTWSDTNNLVTSGCLRVDEYNQSGITTVKNSCSAGSTGSIIYTVLHTGNSTKYVASATLNTNTEFSTYTFGPLTVQFGDDVAREVFGLVGFIILSILLVTAGFIANEHGSDTLILTTLVGMVLVGLVGIIAYAWEAYVGIVILGVILVYKLSR